MDSTHVDCLAGGGGDDENRTRMRERDTAKTRAFWSRTKELQMGRDSDWNIR
jgi:hypothetical protein